MRPVVIFCRPPWLHGFYGTVTAAVRNSAFLPPACTYRKQPSSALDNREYPSRHARQLISPGRLDKLGGKSISSSVIRLCRDLPSSNTPNAPLRRLKRIPRIRLTVTAAQ